MIDGVVCVDEQWCGNTSSKYVSAIDYRTLSGMMNVFFIPGISVWIGSKSLQLCGGVVERQ